MLLKTLEMSVEAYLVLRKLERTEGIEFIHINNIIEVVNETLQMFGRLQPRFENDSMSVLETLDILNRFIAVREACMEELDIDRKPLEVINQAIAIVLGELQA